MLQVSKDGVFVNDKQYTKEELKNWHKNHNVFAVPIVMLSIIAFISFGFCGFFGSGESTGSVGVVTINMPRLAYQSKDEKEFYEKYGLNDSTKDF